MQLSRALREEFKKLEHFFYNYKNALSRLRAA
ncbi:hypothetical protein C5167_003538 [Papaver somniferum]|uniref:Uncharacterized protein n=1 Tax=Papaver somniferum TaxID=3469 RepID=A0A4Y7KUK5_PAPSO|nr:hypothetical protein C5167_003538 [Papaver somniferum]